MKKKILLLSAAIFLLSISFIHAAPVDLSSWSAKTWDFSGHQPAGNWVLSAGNTTVTQIVNADPSAYLNNLNQTNYTMQGSWKVLNASGDDDFMGFVFGYKNSSNFYLFDWKAGTQPYQGTTAQEGLSIKKISASLETLLSVDDFWSSANTNNMTLLASNYGSDKGWIDDTQYDFYLNFQPGVFGITVKLGATTLWDVTVNDSTFPAGQFGFYNFSQEDVQYSGFVQDVIIPTVPEPTTVLLLGIGLIGLAGYGRKK
jgi:hypothetical protein